MPNYTFTTDACFDIDTHRVTFTDTEITITLTSTGQVVYRKDFSGGLALMCKKKDFCTGTLADNGTFSRKVDLKKPKAQLGFEQQHGVNTFWGTDNYDDPGVYNIYDLDLCPIRLSSKDKLVTIECPCESQSGPCENRCYSYGR